MRTLPLEAPALKKQATKSVLAACLSVRRLRGGVRNEALAECPVKAWVQVESHLTYYRETGTTGTWPLGRRGQVSDSELMIVLSTQRNLKARPG